MELAKRALQLLTPEERVALLALPLEPRFALARSYANSLPAAVTRALINLLAAEEALEASLRAAS